MTHVPQNAITNFAIRIENLSVDKGGRTICRVPKLIVSAGERVGIIGPNGSGKTTLLRVIAGLESRSSGHCEIATGQSERVYVHQSPFLFRGTVLHNVEYGLSAGGIPHKRRRASSLEWLDRLGISALAERNVEGLSGGERRRAALARACVLHPRLLLLDEPLADLDESGIECVRQGLAELAGSTLLIASPTALSPELVDRCFPMSGSIPQC